MDIAPLGGELLLQKYGQIDLTDKADTLRVLALGGCQLLLLGNTAHLGFKEVSDREHRILQLLLRELAEKVTLVLVGVATRQERIDLLAIDLALLLTAVVSRSDSLGTQLQRLLQEDIKLNLAVAQHVGVWRAPLLILGEHIIDHALAVLLRQIDIVEGDIKAFGNQLGKDLVVVPRALALQLARRVVPISHK